MLFYVFFQIYFVFVNFIFRKKHNNRLAQEAGTLTCKHCPFRSGNRESLVNHEKYHSANHPFQCQFCTFSSKSDLALKGQHINRVHLEELKVT